MIVDKSCAIELLQNATVTIQDVVMANSVKKEDVIFNAIKSTFEDGLIDYNTYRFYCEHHDEALHDVHVMRFYSAYMRQIQWSKEIFLSVLN